ncbi:MAG: hypothetical protein WCZ28_10140 [Burkholderiaceae bacterium]
MTGTVTVHFAADREFPLRVTEPVERTAAVRWLEDEFVRLGAEPVRASGKILLADRLMSIAVAAGPDAFQADPDWATRYATNALAAIGHDLVTVDLEAMRVRY